MKKKTALSICIGGTAVLVVAVLVAKPLTSVIVADWQPASVEDIRAAVSASPCTKKILQDANRDGREISKRDLDFVSGKCRSVDAQGRAFGADASDPVDPASEMFDGVISDPQKIT